MADTERKTRTEEDIKAQKAKAQKKYMEKFCEIKVRMTKDEREKVQTHAQKVGMSTSTFIKSAISQSSGIVFENGKEER